MWWQQDFQKPEKTNKIVGLQKNVRKIMVQKKERGSLNE
jgi:hypothetical protein